MSAAAKAAIPPRPRVAATAARAPFLSARAGPAPGAALIQRKCACGGSAGLSGECEECSRRKRFGVQRKASGGWSDPLEREADRTADWVTDRGAQAGLSPGWRLSPASAHQLTPAPPSVRRVLAGSGAPLAPVLRDDMERRFGHSFADVRVHTDAEAARSARDVRAHAYTSGSHIVFGAGEYAADGGAGRHLIAHELTHVLQQRGGPAGLQRQADEAAEEGGQTIDTVLSALRTASVIVPGLESVTRTVELMRAVMFFWEHREEHLQLLLDNVGKTLESVPPAAREKLAEFLAGAGTGAEAAGCVGGELVLLLDSLAVNWRATLWSFVKDFFFYGLFERSLPTIIEQSQRLFDDILNGEFRSAIDRSVAIMTEINAIIGVLYLWFALVTTIVGTLAGTEAPVAGNAVGAAAGLTLAQVVNIGLIASVVATETARVGRGIDDMIRFWEDPVARERGCREVAEGVFALTLTGVLFYFGPSIQRFARSIIQEAVVEVRAVATAVSRDASAALERLATPPLVTPEGFRFAPPEVAPPAQRGPAPVRPPQAPVTEPAPRPAAPAEAPAPQPEPVAAARRRPTRAAALARGTGVEPLAEDPTRRTEEEDEGEMNSMRHQIQRGNAHFASRAVMAPARTGVTARQLRDTMAANFDRYMRIARGEETAPKGWTRGPVDWEAPIRAGIITQSQTITGIVAAGGVRQGGDVNALRYCFHPTTLAPTNCGRTDVRLDIENRGHNLRQ